MTEGTSGPGVKQHALTVLSMRKVDLYTVNISTRCWVSLKKFLSKYRKLGRVWRLIRVEEIKEAAGAGLLPTRAEDRCDGTYEFNE